MRSTCGKVNAREAHVEHVPEARLEGFGVGGLSHLVLADDQMGQEDVVEARAAELVARDAGQHHAIAIRKGELPRISRVGRMRELRV